MSRLVSALVLAIAFASPASAQEAVLELGAPEGPNTDRLVIQGSTDIAPFAGMLEAFAARNPTVRLRYEQRGTNDIYEHASRACIGLEESADLVISSSIDQQVKLANDGCAQPHRSERTAQVPDWANWRDEVFGLTLEPAVIVYNRDLLKPDQVPRSRFDLIDLLRNRDGSYDRRIATYDIERSGLGYLFAFADHRESATFGRLIEAFGRNDVVATCCSAEIIDDVASGKYLIAYNMLGSYALARAEEEERIGVVAPSDYTLLMSRAALIPRRAARPDLARQFIDFALSPEGRAILEDASLIIRFGDSVADDRPGLIGREEALLRPIKFGPSLLVGLDSHKKARFLKIWYAGIHASKP